MGKASREWPSGNHVLPKVEDRRGRSRGMGVMEAGMVISWGREVGMKWCGSWPPYLSYGPFLGLEP